MKRLLVSFLTLATLGLAGCPAYSTQPLYTGVDHVLEPALVGTWVNPNSDDGPVVFKKSDGSTYEMVLSDPKTEVTQFYDVHLVRLQGDLFMDIIFRAQQLKDEEIALPLATIPAHLIAKLKIAGDELTYSVLDDKSIRKAAEATGGRVSVSGDDVFKGDVVVTAKTEDLRDFVTRFAGDLFPEDDHLTRKR
jgi:hypothetical protein